MRVRVGSRKVGRMMEAVTTTTIIINTHIVINAKKRKTRMSVYPVRGRRAKRKVSVCVLKWMGF